MVNLNDSPYLWWLENLLPERKKLRLLARELQRLIRSRRDDEAAALSEEIENLIYAPLNLSKSDSITGELFGRLLFVLLAKYATWEVYDDITAVWSGHLIPGLNVRVHPALKDRLTSLCAPLDDLIALKKASLAA